MLKYANIKVYLLHLFEILVRKFEFNLIKLNCKY